MTKRTRNYRADQADARHDENEWFSVDFDRLSARLRFNPDDAHIWLEGERMVLLHLAAFSALRRELIEALGIESARKLLYRMGQVSGAQDAGIARRAMPHAGPIESFKAGPRLHALSGMVSAEEVRLEVDAETGFHMGEWIWRNSAEADAHIAAFGIGGEPVCWTLNGYASAYSSAFIGHPTIYREVECRAMGAPHCRIIGKPAEMWDAEEESFGLIGLEIDDGKQADWLGQPVGGLHGAEPDSTRLVGESPAFAAMLNTLRRVAPTMAPVLLMGEPGTGKKSLAHAIHRLSKRAAKPLHIVNCARQDSTELALDLFGRERTATEPPRPGRLERLNGATLMLEDVQAITPMLQARLMQLLVEKQAERLGGGQPRKFDVRIVASANDTLLDAVRAGHFRQDLYYKLGVCPVAVPPLRDRKADLPLFIRHFLELYAHRHEKRLGGVNLDAASYLLNHDYPGNIAELESMIERAVIMAAEDGYIRTDHLISAADLHGPTFFRVSNAGELVHASSPPDANDAAMQTERMLRGKFNLDAFEAEMIRRAVSQSQGNLSKAARLLGITRPQLAYRYARMKPE